MEEIQPDRSQGFVKRNGQVQFPGFFQKHFVDLQKGHPFSLAGAQLKGVLHVWKIFWLSVFNGFK